MPHPMTAAAAGQPGKGAGRLPWLDVVRFLMILEIIGFHWLRTSQENGSFNLFYAPGYEDVRTGLLQLRYLLTDQTGLSPSSLANNLIGLLFGYGWEAVDLFVLLSGIGLALGYRPRQPGFSLAGWYRRRYARILIPYYVIALPMILAAEAFKAAASGHAGVLGAMAAKLTVKNLPDPLWIELAKHIFLLDPRREFWICDFFSPAWWFLPPILVAYLVFPLLYGLIARLGIRCVLPATFVLTVLGYEATGAGLLPEHGPYFVILHECFNFTVGIWIGGMLQSEAGRARCLAALRSPAPPLLGALLFAGGNVVSWYGATHPFASPIFTAGLALLLGPLAVQLARIRPVLALTRAADSYHIYLLHQWLAFPLVLLTVAVCGRASRAVGFSLGFLLYLVLVLAVVLTFERLWGKAQAYFRRPAPAVAAAGRRGA